MKIIPLSVAYIQIVTYSCLARSVIMDNISGERFKRASIDKACKDFYLMEWSSWGPCFVVMGRYVEARWSTREEPFYYTGPKCPKTWELQGCTPEQNDWFRVRDSNQKRCDVGEWSNWSECYMNGKALKREKERHRYAIFKTPGTIKCSDLGSISLVEYEDCPDCAWTSWTPCYQYFLEKESFWQRYRENKPTYRNGICRGKWVEFEDCDFCEWTQWRSWSPCYKYAMDYERKRERTRKISDSRQGTRCKEMNDHDAEEYGQCPSNQLPKVVPVRRLSSTVTSAPETTARAYTPEATYSFGSNQPTQKIWGK